MVLTVLRHCFSTHATRGCSLELKQMFSVNRSRHLVSAHHTRRDQTRSQPITPLETTTTIFLQMKLWKTKMTSTMRTILMFQRMKSMSLTIKLPHWCEVILWLRNAVNDKSQRPVTSSEDSNQGKKFSNSLFCQWYLISTKPWLWTSQPCPQKKKV